jgi:molecular chaperone DnaK
VLVAAAATSVVLLLDSGNPSNPARGESTQPSRVIAQYEYQFPLPNGWTQTGGDPGRLRTEVKPAGAEQGADLVLVEETRLAFDSNSDRARAVDKLRADFTNAGPGFTGFDDHASFAGRQLIHYRQQLTNAAATVDWYVLFQAHTQVSVGCQYTEPVRDTVRGACATIVRSLMITE